MSPAATPRYGWDDVDWPRLERAVYKLQKRIHTAAKTGDNRKLHRLQRLLLRSKGAKLLATRRVTQDNRGKNTAGVDGVARLKPEARMILAENLTHNGKAQPVRRVWIPKPGKAEKRPLGIPTMEDRAKQALVRMGLEPEWEARFERNSYGFRPGRGAHDAIEAIWQKVAKAPKGVYVLDADIKGCFDNINHKALLDKLKTTAEIRRAVKGWLRAGVLEGDVFHPTTGGTPQGGVISPLLANVALHGLEDSTLKVVEHTRKQRVSMETAKIVRYADDFVVMHSKLEVIQAARAHIERWLSGVGLELKPEKTRIGHTQEGDNPGFNFLGFNIRQYSDASTRSGFKTIIKPSEEAVERHLRQLKETIRALRGTPQVAVISRLNPMIRGWAMYYRTCQATLTLQKLAHLTHIKLWRWACYRHHNKGAQWTMRKYFRTHGQNRWRFMTHEGTFLAQHNETELRKHVMVQGTRSPYDGDWIYWATRLGRHPMARNQVARLMKEQRGRCARCGNPFGAESLVERHHKDGNHANNARNNVELLHAHCHDATHGQWDHNAMALVEEAA